MNEVIAAIKRRRSVRSFKPEQIKDAELKLILEAAIYAPSGNNAQSWFFTVVQNRDLLDRINGWIIDEARRFTHPKAQQLAQTPNALVFRQAPTVVIVSRDPADMLSMENCSIAGQNMMLAAESLGLGSCWIWYVSMLAESSRLPDYQRELRLPPGYVPYFGLTLGYPGQTDLPVPPRNTKVVALLR